MRKNRFRYSKFTKDQFALLLKGAKPAICYFYNLLKTNQITAAEFVAAYLLAIQVAAQPHKILGPKLKNPIVLDNLSSSTTGNMKNGLQFLNYIQEVGFESKIQTRFLEVAKQLSPLEIFNQYSIISIPEGVHRALVSWHMGKYQLELHFNILKASEVLALQATGKRLVTVFTSSEGPLNIFVQNRDPFSFTLHDLIHADLFFHDKVMHREQVLFFQNLQLQLKDTKVSSLLDVDADFRKKIEYVCSDMNTHPQHLHSYLTHTLQEHGVG